MLRETLSRLLLLLGYGPGVGLAVDRILTHVRF